MIVKICGLRRRCEVKASEGADYLGFVMESPRSRRNIDVELFEELNKEVRSKSVIVTTVPDREALLRLDKLGADVIQLHGRAREHRHDLETPYALGLNHSEETFDSNAEYVVVDNTTALHYGGTGKSWKWRPIAQMGCPRLVAGGISKENFKMAIEQTGADGVDLSSTLEVDGVKSPRKIREFLEVVHC